MEVYENYCATRGCHKLYEHKVHFSDYVTTKVPIGNKNTRKKKGLKNFRRDFVKELKLILLYLRNVSVNK